MANIKACLDETMDLEGTDGVVLMDLKTGRTLGMAGNRPNLDIEAATNADLLKAKLKVLHVLDQTDTVEDMVITLGQNYHLIRCIGGAQGLMLYLNLRRAQTDLTAIRSRLSQIESELVL
jgi:hypothetical protein